MDKSLVISSKSLVPLIELKQNVNAVIGANISLVTTPLIELKQNVNETLKAYGQALLNPFNRTKIECKFVE